MNKHSNLNRGKSVLAITARSETELENKLKTNLNKPGWVERTVINDWEDSASARAILLIERKKCRNFKVITENLTPNPTKEGG